MTKELIHNCVYYFKHSGISNPVGWGTRGATLDSGGSRHLRGFREFR